MTFAPTDEQLKAITCVSRQLCISAGAGSGKTRVLAERFAAAVDPGSPVHGWDPADVPDILTVTFTEKAAGEIAERVRRVLIEHGLVERARRVDEAWIATIHGLCARLLRSGALEAGLDPSFSVITDIEARLLREEALEIVLRDALTDGTAVDLVGTYGAGIVGGYVTTVYDRLRAMGAMSDDLVLEEGIAGSDVLARCVRAIPDMVERLRAHPKPGKTLTGIISSAGDAHAHLRELADRGPAGDAELSRSVLRILQAFRPSGNVGGAKDLVAEVSAQRVELLDGAIRAVSVPLAVSLAGLVRSFADTYDAMKAARGVLDYEDLQLRAVRLLETRRGSSGHVASPFRLVMIDEFQDTNEVQTRLIDLLAHGNLCTVGDDRQSIYAFRYADVDVFRAHTVRMIEAGAETALLAANFRSHADVLVFVNEVFSSEALFGADFLRLEHGRDESNIPAWPDPNPRIEVLRVQRSSRSGERARLVEADAIAGRLRHLADLGVRPGDMVLLLRAMTHVDDYATALRRHGLDYTVSAGGAFLGRPEIEAMRSFLRAAANPLDDEALVSFLASGMVGLSDDGLLRMRRAAGADPLWRSAGSCGLEPRDARAAQQALASLESARSQAGRRPVAEIIHQACEDLDYDLYLLALGSDGRRAYANVLKLARLAEEFEHAGGSGVQDFIAHLALKERFRDREAPAAVVDERGDAVRIMSVHAAKGLEFLVVAVPELGMAQSSDRDALVLRKEGRRAWLALALPSDGDAPARGRRSSAFQEALAASATRDRDEEQRLLYVACTRAREALLLSGSGDFHKTDGRETAVGWVSEALGLEPRSGEGCDVVVIGEDTRISVVLLEDTGPIPPPIDHCASPAHAGTGPETEEVGHTREQPTGSASAMTPSALSYSRLRLYSTCPLRYWASCVGRLGTACARTDEDPLTFGDAVHAALRIAGPGTAPPPEERLAAIARQWNLSEQGSSRLRGAVARYHRSDVCARVSSLGRVEREVPFALPLQGVTLTGGIDLLAGDGVRTLVVDYKTGKDAVRPEDARERYKEQADCYGLAALTGGAERVEVVFVGVETGGDGPPREVTFSYGAGDTESLRATISEQAGALAHGPYEPLSRYEPAACDQCPAAGSICPVRIPETRRGG